MKIVLGTMTFGRDGVGARIKDPEIVKQALDEFHSHGHSELDTARMYCGGKTEEMLAEVRATAPTWPFSLATKVYPVQGGDHAPERLKATFNKSLEALQTNRDYATPLEDTLRAVNELHQEAKFTTFAISNYPAWMVTQIHYICKENGYVPPSIYQGMYNAITRDVERELLPCLRKLGIAFYLYNPLCGGLLAKTELKVSEEVEQGSRFDPSTNQGSMYRNRYWNQVYFEAVSRIAQACEFQGLTLAEAALRWCKHHSKLDAELGDAIIIGASSVPQLQANLVALEQGPLPPSIVDAFEEAWYATKAVCPPYFR